MCLQHAEASTVAYTTLTGLLCVRWTQRRTTITKNEMPNARSIQSKMLQNRRSSSSFVDSCAYLITNIVFGWFFSRSHSFFVVIVTLCAVKFPETLYFPFIDIHPEFVNVPPVYVSVYVCGIFALRCSNSSITLRLLVLFHEWNTKWVNVCDVCCLFSLSLHNITGSEISAFSSPFEWFIQFPWMFMTHSCNDANFGVCVRFFTILRAIHKNICDHLWFRLMSIPWNVYYIKRPSHKFEWAAIFSLGNNAQYKQTNFTHLSVMLTGLNDECAIISIIFVLRTPQV